MVYNPQTKQNIITYNSDKFFTPASTVKLFTLYTSLHYLKDSIATVAYFETDDTLYLQPLADPSFLHDSLPNKTYNFLAQTDKKIVLIPDIFEDFIYGNGWQWDDFQYYYMPEKSIFPIYGNVVLSKGKNIIPAFFKDSLSETTQEEMFRDFFKNQFYYNPVQTRSIKKIPFKTSLSLSIQLLSDTIHKPIYKKTYSSEIKLKPYISSPTKPLYSRLMNESENFMAEQLFLIISKEKTNEYKVENTIQLALDSLFVKIPQFPRWVDASGLSRYNLFTPHDMVYLLDLLQHKYGQKNAMDFLPKNGEKGAIQKWYPSKNTYLYAKTGSVSNNHNLCGYIITKKGTFLIFSYMNNNFMSKSSDVREKMNQILLKIYNTY